MTNAAGFSKIVLPVIRGVEPTVIAAELVQAQPMADPLPSTFWSFWKFELAHGTSYYPDTNLPKWYWVKCVHATITSIYEMKNFAYETFGDCSDDTWKHDADCNRFLFRREQDRTLFLLKWAK